MGHRRLGSWLLLVVLGPLLAGPVRSAGAQPAPGQPPVPPPPGVAPQYGATPPPPPPGYPQGYPPGYQPYPPYAPHGVAPDYGGPPPPVYAQPGAYPGSPGAQALSRHDARRSTGRALAIAAGPLIVLGFALIIAGGVRCERDATRTGLIAAGGITEAVGGALGIAGWILLITPVAPPPPVASRGTSPRVFGAALNLRF